MLQAIARRAWVGGVGCLFVLSLAACTREVSNRAPKRGAQSIEVTGRESTITIPISARLADLEERLNQELPETLYAVDDRFDGCIPAKVAKVCPVPRVFRSGCAVDIIKTKISPEIDCTLTGAVKRGRIRLTGEGQTVRLDMPISLSVTARGRGEIGERIRETAEGAADVTAVARFDIDQMWNPTATVTPTYNWTDRIHVRILGQKITFASKVNPKIDEAISKFERTLPDQLAGLKVQENISRAWASGFSSISLNENPSVWLRFAPTELGYSGYTIADETLTLKLMARGSTETFIGPKPADPRPTALPPLRRNLPPAGFHFYLPVTADYAVLERLLGTQLKLGQAQVVNAGDVGPVKVTFSGVRIYNTEDGAIAVGVTLDADPQNDLFDVKGTVWLTAKPVVDNRTRRISIASLGLASETNQKGFDLLVAILQAPVINNAIKSQLAYDFDVQYVEALARANSLLKRQISPEIYLHGEVDEVAVERITATPQGLFLGLDVTGTGELRYGVLPTEPVAAGAAAAAPSAKGPA